MYEEEKDMILARVRVTDVRAHVECLQPIPRGIIGGQVRILFDDPMWDELTKTVVIKGSRTRDIVNPGEIVTIPTECVSRARRHLYVGVYGTDGEDNVAVPTLWADLGRIRGAADPSGDESTEESLPVWAQLQEQIDALKENSSASGGGGSIFVDEDGYLTTSAGGFEIDGNGYILL